MPKIESDNPFDRELNELLEIIVIEKVNKGEIIGNLITLEEQTRSGVIIRYLVEGDTRALAHWLSRGVELGPNVRKLLSAMLQPVRRNDDGRRVEVPVDQVPFELVAKRRSGAKGRRRDLVADERARVTRDLASRWRAEDPRIQDKEIIARLKERLPGMSESLIRNDLADPEEVPKPRKKKKKLMPNRK